MYEKYENYSYSYDSYNITNTICVSNDTSPTNSRRWNERNSPLTNGDRHHSVDITISKKMRESDWTASFFYIKKNIGGFFTTSKKTCYNK